MTPEEKWALSDAYIAKVLNPGERVMVVAIRQFFTLQHARNLALVKSKLSGGARVMPQSLLLDRHSENLALQTMMVRHYKKQAGRAAKLALAQINAVRKVKAIIKADDDYLPATVDLYTKADIKRIIAKRLLDISAVNNTTFKGVETELAAIITQATEDELSTRDLMRNIETGLARVYGGRKANAMRIARTETGTITSQVQYAIGRRVGGVKKGWLSTRDEHVRTTHEACDAEGFIAYDTNFVNDLRFPLDPNGAAKEVINCRCALIFSAVKEDEKGITDAAWSIAFKELKGHHAIAA